MDASRDTLGYRRGWNLIRLKQEKEIMCEELYAYLVAGARFRLRQKVDVVGEAEVAYVKATLEVYMPSLSPRKRLRFAQQIQRDAVRRVYQTQPGAVHTTYYAACHQLARAEALSHYTIKAVKAQYKGVPLVNNHINMRSNQKCIEAYDRLRTAQEAVKVKREDLKVYVSMAEFSHAELIVFNVFKELEVIHGNRYYPDIRYWRHNNAANHFCITLRRARHNFQQRRLWIQIQEAIPHMVFYFDCEHLLLDLEETFGYQPLNMPILNVERVDFLPLQLRQVQEAAARGRNLAEIPQVDDEDIRLIAVIGNPPRRGQRSA